MHVSRSAQIWYQILILIVGLRNRFMLFILHITSCNQCIVNMLIPTSLQNQWRLYTIKVTQHSTHECYYKKISQHFAGFQYRFTLLSTEYFQWVYVRFVYRCWPLDCQPSLSRGFFHVYNVSFSRDYCHGYFV